MSRDAPDYLSSGGDCNLTESQLSAQLNHTSNAVKAAFASRGTFFSNNCDFIGSSVFRKCTNQAAANKLTQIDTLLTQRATWALYNLYIELITLALVLRK